MSLPHHLPEPSFDANAMRVLDERYLVRRSDGNLESPKEWLWRVASAIAEPERTYAEVLGRDPQTWTEGIAASFYSLMCRRDFLPNTPCLVNAGRPLSMLSACFVLPVPDSIDGIFASVKAMAEIQKAGGGTGFSFSQLRGRGAAVASTGREASGPVSFMKVFNAATDSIKQGGVRRGANMGVLRVDHPDIFAFIRCKQELDAENLALFTRLADGGRIAGAALAALKQEFLQSQFSNFNLSIGITDRFMQAVDADGDFDLIDPRDGQAVRSVRARDVWDAIVAGAWQNGEPGVLFLDHPEINPLPGLGPIEATNPCGEVFLHGYDSCNLGSINVGHFFDGMRRDVDWQRLGDTVVLAVRFLDNVIDATAYPLDEIREMSLGNRRIGLGIMGFADLLVQLELPYGSPAAVAFAAKLMKFIQERAQEASETLARERGDFPNKHLSKWAGDARPRRNATLLSIAPTGTISMLAGASFGCEPYFGITYTKHVMKDGHGRAQPLSYVVPQFEEIACDLGFFSDDLLVQIEANGGSVRGLPDVPEDLQAIFASSGDLSPEQHIDMLAALQRYTCNAVSKSINAPHSDTPEHVARAIVHAYRSGCKGFTYYRNGSRSEQVVTYKAPAAAPVAPRAAPAAVRPTGYHSTYLEALGVAIAIGLRYADGISQVLARTTQLALAPGNGHPAGKRAPQAAFRSTGTCPQCGGSLVSQSGCVSCLADCGYIGQCG